VIAWGIDFLIGVAVGVAIMALLRFEAYSLLESELEQTRCRCKQTGFGTIPVENGQ
jgi:uncharacterized membrane-anchored protein YhcB (DUF1043 family)